MQERAELIARQDVPEVDRVTLIGQGQSSEVYRLDAPDRAYVLLLDKENAAKPADYGHTYSVLELLEKNGYKYAPKPVWCADDNSSIIMTYADGQESQQFDFTVNGVDAKQVALEVVDAALDMARMPYDEYVALAKKHHFEPTPVVSMAESIDKHGPKQLEYVTKYCPDKDIVDWLTSRIASTVADMKRFPEDIPTFKHRDLSNPNILIGLDGTVSIVDWNSARFDTGSFAEIIAYMTTLVDFMEPYTDDIVTYAAERLGIPTQDFAEHVATVRKLEGVFGVNWAAQVMGQIASGELDGNIEDYRAIAYERMKQYEKRFER